MINRLLMFFVNLMQKYLPDPFSIAWIISLVVVALAIGVTHKTPLEVATYWGQGFFDILAFSMQMTLVIVTGYALASAGVVRRFLQTIARIPKTPKQTVFFIAVVSMVLYYLNWGLGLIAGGLLAREAAKLHPDVDFRLLVAAAFSEERVARGRVVPLLPVHRERGRPVSDRADGHWGQAGRSAGFRGRVSSAGYADQPRQERS